MGYRTFAIGGTHERHDSARRPQRRDRPPRRIPDTGAHADRLRSHARRAVGEPSDRSAYHRRQAAHCRRHSRLSGAVRRDAVFVQPGLGGVDGRRRAGRLRVVDRVLAPWRGRQHGSGAAPADRGGGRGARLQRIALAADRRSRPPPVSDGRGLGRRRPRRHPVRLPPQQRDRHAVGGGVLLEATSAATPSLASRRRCGCRPMASIRSSGTGSWRTSSRGTATSARTT